MEYLSESCRDALGEFHNSIVELIDKTGLTPPEVITVLMMAVSSIEKFFEASVCREE